MPKKSESKKRDFPEWKQYEDAVYARLLKLVNLPGAEVLSDQKVPSFISGERRQIDILIQAELGDSKLTWIVDCKFYSKKIDVKGVEEFLGLLKDVGAQKGILVTTMGFSRAAIRRARRDESDIDLWLINFGRLAPYQGLAALLFWVPGGVALFAPSGWLIDSRRNRGEDAVPEYPVGQAFLHPIGVSLVRAWQDHDCFIYCNITVDATMEELIENQKSAHSGALQNFLPVRHSGPYEIRARTIEVPEKNTIEDTIFIDYKRFVFWSVLLSPLDKPAFTAWGRQSQLHLMETAIPFLAEGNYLEEEGMTFTPLDDV